MNDFVQSGAHHHQELEFQARRIRLPRPVRIVLIMAALFGTALVAMLLHSPAPELGGGEGVELSGKQKLYGNLLRVMDHTDRVVHMVSGGLGADRDLIGEIAGREMGDAGWQRNFSASLIRIGRLRWRDGDQEGALRIFTQAVTIRRRLLAQEPENPEWRRRLVAGLYRQARALHGLDRSAEALVSLEEADGIMVKLVAQQPEMRLWLQWRESLNKWIGRAHDNLGQTDQATHHYGLQAEFRRQRFQPFDDGEHPIARQAYSLAQKADAGYAPQDNYGKAKTLLEYLGEHQELSPRQKQWLETISRRITSQS